MNILGLEHLSLQNIPHVVLPIGISFYTFQSMSYTLDVYQGNTKATKNYIDFAAYITLFPQLIAGPIVRYVDVSKQLKEKNISVDNFALGVKRFITGLAKKMLIANTCAALADSAFESPVDELSTIWAWAGILAYSLQIYFDFSGYSDMAIGLGKMLGFDFLENFNYPYIAQNIREFWQRWHISLSTWFRDYVYIPLGGSRTSSIKVYRNLLVVFFVTGLWHGASWNFIVWGLLHGLFIILERSGLNTLLDRLWSPIRYTYTMVVVMIGWVFFRAENLTHGVEYLSKMFSLSNGDRARTSYFSYFYSNPEYVTIGIIGILWSTSILDKFFQSVFNKESQQPILRWIEMILLFVLFIIAASYVAADTYNPFIYFRF